jgi:choline dehydrogenase-like flavoprotein
LIVDLERASTYEVPRADVCVIGAGASGIALSVELSRQGRRVLLLEGGGRDFEARSQDLYVGESMGLPHIGLYNGRCRVLGGTTTRWGGQILEIDEHVFGPRPGVDGGAWPILKQELMAAYARATELEGLEQALVEPDTIWRELGFQVPDLGEELTTGFSRWCPVANFARLHGASLRVDPRIVVFLHANVCELRLAEDGATLRSVGASTLSGRRFEFQAPVFVLATGGIETCRLLLQPLPNGSVAPWGAHGLIGRYYQDHLSCFVATLPRGALASAGNFDYVAARGFRYHPKLKLKPKTQARLGTLDVCGTVALTSNGVDHLARTYETLRFWQTRQWRSITPSRAWHFALHAHKLLWHRFPYTRRATAAGHGAEVRLCVHCEQEPLSAGRITLGNERDRLGLLRVRTDWRTSSLELHSIRAYVGVIKHEFAARGLGAVLVDAGVESDDALLCSRIQESFHHIGGTRMGLGPADGVVNPDLKLFGTRNAYVCSSSVFPSAGFANPTHTVLALAVRLAAHLAGPAAR